MTSYSPWEKQVKPLSSLRKKMANNEQEKKENNEKRDSNSFTLVRENKCGKKRSRKYRKLDMGHSAPSIVASVCPTMTITTSTAILSASAPTSLSTPAPSGQPSTSNTLSLPKIPVQKQKESERISKAIRRENRNVAEEECRKKAKERTLSCAQNLWS